MAVFLPSWTGSSLALAASLPQQLNVERRITMFSDENALERRIVWNPEITQPNRRTLWNRNTTATISWNASAIPKGAYEQKGKVVLGWLNPNLGGGEHLNIEHPLAHGFNLRDGRVQITVPQVAPRDDYIVVLFGDSGNASPNFSIV
ncbi:hypothetical protein PC9H_006201 [Pleurotus ostreatus]|uniref:Uncharacterized protein n=1 Tax=Pleurotus ostreatus TaxID=5322 RepID=A0A8H6ZVS3_PLEOS|nr:uncharacterized protein PC9H_006201 [Pleurotus ostreatus]KAF7430493.1 hypothetical protein PC9H_006201 [Pleurotus ostreatus]KAJ8694770.1 hypothetical protein PTI98_007420 [Pleurotus ostreatus]